MDRYEEFAELYAEGEYTDHSAEMADLFPKLLDRYEINPESLLDLACGEGTFLRNIEEVNRRKGIDLSENLIDIARSKSGSSIEFDVCDMRSFSESGFDVVTCWYDSLNYMTSKEDLRSAFENTFECLNSGGYFIFDMNTRYWLSEGWPSQGKYVGRDDKDFFELHRPSYDEESEIFELKITGFKRSNGHWDRFEEIHREKSYELSEIKSLLKEQGFEIIDVLGEIEEEREPFRDDQRIWFVARKKE